ncbi:MAG: peptide ABC transporter substrate-binding protein [bacterium]|nr:peptide ABC transporter substrate-binding protein [bacterium]
MFKELVKIATSFSKLERYVFIGTLIILLVAGGFWLLHIYDNLTVVAPARGGHYTEGVVGQPVSLNPLISGVGGADRDLVELLFADLDELAENIKVSDDNKTWIVTLKPKLKWSDGEPLTTADVLFTLETIQNPDTQSPTFSTWQGVVGQRISDQEIHFALKNPYVFFADNLKTLKIVPRHIFGNIPPSNLRLSNYNLEPIGSGPYKFVSYDKERNGFISRYTLGTNEYYAGQEPFIEDFGMTFFINEVDAVKSFNRREIDGLGGLSPQGLENLRIGHKVLSINMPRYYAIFINQSTHPALKEKTVRDAMATAIDRSAIIKTVFDNQAVVVDGPLPSIIDGYSPKSGGGATDLSDVVASLEKSGWELNADGVREKTIDKRKVKLDFTLQVPQVDFLIKTADMISDQLSSIGVHIKIVVLSAVEANEVIRNRNYSLIIFGNTLRGNPDAFSFWHSSERFYPGLNLAIYNDKTVDSLLENIRQDFDDEIRKEKLTRLQNIIRGDQPAVFLLSPNYLYVAVKNLGGLENNVLVLASDRFKNVEGWFLKTNRVLR